MTPQELSQKIQQLSQQFNVAIRSNKWSEALQFAQNLVKLNPEGAVCYNYRGFAYFKLGELEKSRIDFEHVLRLDPNNKNACSMLEKIKTIKPVISTEEHETVPIEALDAKAYNEANQETQILPNNMQTKLPKEDISQNNFEDSFIEEGTTQVIVPQIITNNADTLPEQEQKDDQNNPYLQQKISIPLIIAGSSVLLVGVFIGVFFLGEPTVNKTTDIPEKNNYTTIFDNNTSLQNINFPTENQVIKNANNQILELNSEAITSEENADKKDETNSNEKTEVLGLVAEKTNNSKTEEIALKVTAEETVFEIKKVASEEINEKTDSNIKTEKKEKKISTVEAIEVDFMGVTIDLAISKNIVFVIDNSSSMQKINSQYKKSRWNLCIEAFHDFLPQLIKNKVRFNIVLYNTKPIVFYDKLQITDDKTKENTQEIFKKHTPVAGTNIYDALSISMKMANTDTIILICDGPPGTGTYVTYHDIINNITQENKKNIIIHSISLFALGSTKKFLEQLATKNNGQYYSH